VLTGALLGLSACGGGKTSAEGNATTTSADKISTLPANAPAISSARKKSQSNWARFVSSFEKKPRLTYSVKVSLPAKGGGDELIWVHVTSIDGDTIKGTLDNDPVRDLGLKYGDPVSVKRGDVQDWAVWKDGKVVLGGFSLPAASRGSG
jgi:uncharacterized protein YegJ (DUF2314 family)